MKPSLVIFLIIALLFIDHSPMSAQDVWSEVNGPDGGPVYTIFEGASANFCITPAGVFKSTDTGLSWNQSTPLSIKNLYKGSAAFNGYIYAATTNYTTLLYRSTDNGSTWQQRLNGGLNFNAVEVSSNGTVFAGTFYMFSFHGQFIQDGNIYRSTDNGNSFVQMNFPPLAVSSLKISPSGKVFVATTEGLFVSANNGSSFGLLRSGASSRVFVTSGGFIFINSSGNNVLRSTDDGKSWITVSSGDEAKFPLAEDLSGNIYSDHLGKIYKSTDDGLTWNLFANISGETYSEISSIIFKNEGKILVSTSKGIYRSDDNGITWHTSNPGLRDPQVQVINVRNNIIFTGSYNNASRSTDNGSTWNSMLNGLPEGYIKNIVTTFQENVFVEVAVRGLFLSEDNGMNWETVSSLPQGTSIKHMVADGNKLWITTENGELLVTNDNGKTWINKNSNLPDSIQLMGICITNQGEIYASVERSSWFDPLKGIYRSTNDGTTWIVINDEFSPEEMKFTGNGTMIARSSSTLLISTNSGAGFTMLTSPQEYVTEYEVHENGTVIMQVAFNEEYYLKKSVDNGNTWTDITGILAGQLVYDFAFDLNDRILTATQSGVFRSDKTTSVFTSNENVPSGFQLSQNYPNPFNPNTIINFRMSASGRVLLKVFDVSGREVSTLADEYLDRGEYSKIFNGSSISSGIYFYSLKVNGNVISKKKMMLLK